MKAHSTAIFAVTLAISLFTLPSIAFADHWPKSCTDGYNQYSSKKYKRAISTLTKCLKIRSLAASTKAAAYYNRSLSYYELSFKEKSFKKADKYLELAEKDVDKSIRFDRSYGNAYCLRGNIWLEFSFGEVGYDDLKKGLAKGGSKKFCSP